MKEDCWKKMFIMFLYICEMSTIASPETENRVVVARDGVLKDG